MHGVKAGAWLAEGGRIEHERESVEVFFIVAAAGGQELTGVKVRDADQKPAAEIGRELTSRCAAINAGSDPELGPPSTAAGAGQPSAVG